MLNHECDISKLLQQIEVSVSGTPETNTSNVDKDFDLLYNTKPPRKKKPKSKAQQLAEKELETAKGELKGKREKLIATTQEKLEKLAEREQKPRKEQPPSVGSTIAKTIASNHTLPTEQVVNAIHKALGTVPSDSIDSYLVDKVEAYKALKFEATKRQIERNTQKQAIGQYKEGERNAKTAMGNWQKQWLTEWKAEQAKYDAEQRAERSKYTNMFKDLLKSNPEWKRQETLAKLLQLSVETDPAPKQIKALFTQATGLAYLGDGDVKRYLERIDEAKKLKDPYEKTKALSLIQRDLSNEVPNGWSDFAINWIRTGLLSSPAGALRDVIGTLTEGQALSGGKPLIPQGQDIIRFGKEAMLGINTLQAGISQGQDYSDSMSGDPLRLPPSFKAAKGVKTALTTFGRGVSAGRDSVAKAVYKAHFEQVYNRYYDRATTPEEKATVLDYAHMAGAYATYSPVHHLTQNGLKFGYTQAWLESVISTGLQQLNAGMKKAEKNKNENAKAMRTTIGALRVLGVGIAPFAGFMVRLATRTTNFTAAPWLAAGKLAQLGIKLLQARTLNLNSIMSIEEAIQTDAIISRGLWSAVSTGALAALIDLGAIAFPDEDGEDDERNNRSVGLYAPQLNFTQLVAIATGNGDRKVSKDDLLLGLAMLPATSVMVHVANGYRKAWKNGIATEEGQRLLANNVAKAYVELFTKTPANQALANLVTAKNEEGEKDTSKGFGQMSIDLLKTAVPLVVRRPIETLSPTIETPLGTLNKNPASTPSKPKSALPTVIDTTTGDVAMSEAKHAVEQRKQAEWGIATYSVLSLLNNVLNPTKAELQTANKAIVAEFNRKHLSKTERENLAGENLLKVRPSMYVPESDSTIPTAKAKIFQKRKLAQQRLQARKQQP